MRFINSFLVIPQVISTMPMSGDTELPLDSKIVVTFSQPMIKDTVEENFVIRPFINGNLSWESNSLVFTPEENFKRDQEIKIRFDGTPRGQNLLPLKNPGVITFTTLSNPYIAMASPRGSITEKVTNIVVMFNKSMKKPEGSILEVVPEIEGEEKWVGSSAYMIKSENLVKGEKYTVRLIQDLESVDGGKLSAGYEFGFVNFAPAILDMEVEGAFYNSTNDVDPNGPFTVYFNQSIEQQSLRERVRLFDRNTREQIPFNLYFSSRTKEDDRDYYAYQRRGWEQKVEIYPQRTLEPDMTYTLQIDPGFKSSEGDALAVNGRSLNVTTASLPGFIDSSIKEGEEEVGEDHLRLSFKSPMDAKEIERNLVVKKDILIMQAMSNL